MTFREVLLSIEGLRDRDIISQYTYRRITAIVASSGMNGGKIASKIEKMWPLPKLPGAKENNYKDVLRRHREYEALNKANEKVNARRTKDTSRGGRSGRGKIA